MNEIVIGGNLEPNFNSLSLWQFADISQNSKFYILNNQLFNYRIYVVKESKEGELIKDWISNEKNRNNASVQDKSLELILPYLKKEDILKVIEEESSLAFNRGYKEAQKNMQIALGLREQ